MRRRLLAIFLTLTMALAVFPASALATGDDPDTGEPSEDTPTCICTELCTEEGNPDCPVCLADYSACEGTAPEETGDEPTEEPGEPQQPENTLTEESTQVELLQARIDALPTVEELSAMGAEERDAAYQEAISIDDAILELPDEDQALLNTAKLLAVFDWFEQQKELLDVAQTNDLEGAEGSDLAWSLTDGTLVISGSGAMKDYGYSGHTEVPWYDQRASITKVVFEDGVTHIGSFAFYQHTALASFEMADSVVSFGSGAFQGCSALTTIPKLHANFQDFSTEVFVDTQISAYEVDDANPYYTVKDGIVYSKDGTTLINCPPGKEAVFNQSWLNGVTTIAPYAFRTCRSLTGSLEIPAHITSIGRQAFQNCSGLTGDLTVPNTVIDLDGYYTFAGMSGMTGKLTLGSNFTEIAGGMFNGSGFTTMEWQGAVTFVDNNAFTNCNFIGFTLPESLTTVGNYAFRNCDDNGDSFGSLEHLTSIGTYAFGGCNLGTITIKDAEVASNAFNGATITSVTYSAPTLTRQAFNDAEVETFTLTNDVTFIGSGNFTNTTSVSASLISVRTIEANAFDNVTITTDISIPAIADVGNNAFDEAKLKNVSYNAETASYAVFKGATMDSLTLGDNTIEISPYAFQYSEIGGDVLKLGKVEKIGSYAFGYANLPATVIIPETATYYNNHVFYDVTGGKTLLVYGSYNMVPTALTHGSSFETVVITANIADNSSTTYGDNQKAHNRLTSMPNGHIIYMTNDTSRINADVPNHNGAVGVTNGGTFAPSTNFESGKLATPIKDGFKFDGWYTDSSFSEGSKVTEGTAISNKATYYAKWTEASGYDIAEGDENKTLTMTYGETPDSKTATVEVSVGSISKVESSNDAIIKATFEGITVTITAADNLNAGTYTETVYVYAADESTHWINVSLTVNKADSTVNPDEDSVHITATYGETITLTAEVAKAQTNGIALMTAQDEVEFLCGETSLGTALVRYSDDSHTTGTATLIYDTSQNGIPVGTTSTITAVYGGSVNLNGSNTDSIQVTLNKINTSIDIAPDRTPLIGGGTVTLTVDTSKLPEGGTVSVSCDKDDIKIVENDNGTYTAEMPNRGGEYTFTAVYNGDAWYNGATATCTVTVVTKATPVEPVAVGYLVEYYLEGRWGYELEDTEFFTGKIGDTVTAQPKDYPGYRYNERISTASGTLIVIEDEGDIVTLKLYYDERTTSRPSGGSSEPSYTVSVEDLVNGTVETDPRRAQEGEEVTITVTPDDGYELDTLTVIDRDGDEVEVTEERDGTFTFEMPDSRVTIEATFVPVAEDIVPEIPTDWANPYVDVAANAWYYDAVAYVTANGLMNGTSATTFAPNVTTTRAMIWTVLARMNGQSVDGGTLWYTLAQSWAVTANVSDGTNPGNPISREELATMLYRAAGSPAVSGNLLSYPDGSSVAAWAESAMLWATQNGIISGIDGMLTPQGQATRAQVATMLMRFREAI